MQTASEIMKMILQVANICIIAYGFYKFLGKPHSTLEQRVVVLENEIKDLKRSQDKTNDELEHNDDSIQVIQTALLALIEFEIQFCISHNEGISEELKKAKDMLHDYLARKK